MDLKGNLPHLHFVLDVAEHLGMKLRLSFTELTNLVSHDLLYLRACLGHLLVREFVLELGYRGLLLGKCVLSLDLLSLCLVLLVGRDGPDKIASTDLLDEFLDEAVVNLAASLVFLLELSRFVKFPLTSLTILVDLFDPLSNVALLFFLSFLLLSGRSGILLARPSMLLRSLTGSTPLLSVGIFIILLLFLVIRGDPSIDLAHLLARRLL